MLHEVFLALSGHQSPLFDDAQSFPYVSPSERALLQTLGHLADLHRALKQQSSLIVKKHSSTICRAVANAIKTRHLARFQKAILDIEQSVLNNDSAYVGAFKSVPLASIVGAFGSWQRLLEWLWDLSQFILPIKHGDSNAESHQAGNGPAAINKLRQDCLTGFQDVEQAAGDLLQVAELAWLRQLSAHLTDTDTLPSDFFIQRKPGGGKARFRVSKRNLPDFVSPSTATSILNIGKMSRFLDREAPGDQGNSHAALASSPSAASFQLQQMQRLSAIQLPLSTDKFSDIISDIRAALLHELTKTLLPSARIFSILNQMQSLFLLTRTDFADALIVEADSYMRVRHAQLRSSFGTGSQQDLTAITMREAELSSILSRTWSKLAGEMGNEHSDDRDLEWGQENLRLVLTNSPSPTAESGDEDLEQEASEPEAQKGTDAIPFNDFLLAAPTQLSTSLPAPLDLVLTRGDVKIYTSINEYLLAIRRAYLRLTDLWRQAPLRKGAAFVAGPKSSYKYRIFTSEKLRKRFAERDNDMRSSWATASRAVYMLLELGDYLISSVCHPSWAAFDAWVTGKPADNGTTQGSSGQGDSQPETQNDPESIAKSHRQFLRGLRTSLLLEQRDYLRALRTGLQRVDQFVAFFQRLQSVQAKLDLADEGVDDGFSEKYIREEQELKTELHGAGLRLEGSMTALVETLKSIDQEGKASGRVSSMNMDTGFEPWADASVDRLIMRLDLDPAG